MSKNPEKNVADYIVPLHMNGLSGRMLYLPAPKNKTRQILLLYGSHASLERMLGFAEELNRYGTVTIPDLPGFGGMESFYKIGEKPTLDNLADYLASFIKLRYKRRRLTIMGVSFGFVVVTRMLQKHPDLAKKIDMVVSIIGFVHNHDFAIAPSTKLLFRYAPVLYSRRFPAWVLKTFVLRGPLISAAYSVIGNKNAKLKDVSAENRKAIIDFEIGLWKSNDIRTYMDTTITMMTLDLCDKHVNLPVYHVAVTDDHFFDNHNVEQHMRVIFTDFTRMNVRFGGHAPTVVANAKEAAPFIPQQLRRLLNSN